MKKRGFTLVEIMIVVAIIIILVSIAIAAGVSAKKVARDNQRKTDILLIQVKLESYMAQYGVYPTSLDVGSDSLISKGIISTSVLPHDPSTKADYKYVPLEFSGGTCGASYHLGAELENDTKVTSAVPTTGLTTCAGGTDFPFTNKTYDVTSPDSFVH